MFSKLYQLSDLKVMIEFTALLCVQIVLITVQFMKRACYTWTSSSRIRLTYLVSSLDTLQQKEPLLNIIWSKRLSLQVDAKQNCLVIYWNQKVELHQDCRSHLNCNHFQHNRSQHVRFLWALAEKDFSQWEQKNCFFYYVYTDYDMSMNTNWAIHWQQYMAN